MRLAVVLKGDEQEVLRPPRSAVVDSAARKGLILPGTFFLKSLEPLSSALDFQCIIDTGCEAIGVIGYELVPDLVRTKAHSPIRLIGAGSNSLKGGTHCIHGALLLPVSHKGKYVRARCPDATLYIADIGSRAIVGYPLLARYGLAVFPGQGSLIFEEDLSGETITVPASEPPPGLELTQVERDNPIRSVVPLYSVSAPTVTEDGPSDFNRDEGSVRPAFVDGCHVPASAGYLCAPQTHDVSCAGERAQGSLGTSVPWSERFNSPSPTIDTLTYSEVTAPHATVDTTHTILNTQSVPQEMMERPSQVLLSPAGTSCGSGPDAQVIPPTIIPITPELQGSLLTPSSAGSQPEQGLRDDPSAVHKLTGAAFKGSDPESQSTGWDCHKLVSVVLALSGSIAAQAGIHQNSRGWIEKDTPPASAPTRGDPQLVDAQCIMTCLLAGLRHQAKAPHSVQPEKHSAWPEVPTTGEPIRLQLRVPAAGADWDQTKEAMVDETLSSLFPTPTVLPSPDIQQELSDQGPAAQLQVSGDLTKMIAVFAEDWLDIGDQELSGVRSVNVHDQDFESCSGDEGSLGFDPPDEFMGRFEYSRDHGGVEFGAMNISVMDLQDPQDKAPMASPAPTGVSQEILPIRP